MCLSNLFQKIKFYFKKKPRNKQEFEFLSLSDKELGEEDDMVYYTLFYNGAELSKKFLGYRELCIKELTLELLKRGRAEVVSKIWSLDTDLIEILLDHIIELRDIKEFLHNSD